MAQIGFYHNNDECIGCKACVIACKDKNDLPLGEKYRKVYDYAKCEWNVDDQGVCVPSDYYAYSVSATCNHCEAPACLSVCPVGAIYKREEDGVVWIDEEACIGCEACVAACPFEAPYMSAATGVAHKCDFCIDLIDLGEIPQCVAACPARCLNYGDIEALRSSNEGLLSVPPISDNTSTGPSVVYKPSRMHPNGEADGLLTSTIEEITSETV